jgi:hypothetical protein
VITELSDRTRKQSRQPRAEIASIFHKEITRRLGLGRVSLFECEKDLAGRDTPAKSFRRPCKSRNEWVCELLAEFFADSRGGITHLLDRS